MGTGMARTSPSQASSRVGRISVLMHKASQRRRNRPSQVPTGAGTPAVPHPRPSRDSWFWIAIAVLTLCVYLVVRDFDFISYDDPLYAQNEHVVAGPNLSGLEWALRSTEGSNWVPLTRLSYLLDTAIFGFKSGWFHLANVIYHSVAAVLLWMFLRRSTGSRWRSTLVAALFALHPLHVESVAWISERKDTLSACFFGSARETDRMSISCGFPESHEFGPGGRHALRL
jgi:hypothetical protein